MNIKFDVCIIGTGLGAGSVRSNLSNDLSVCVLDISDKVIKSTKLTRETGMASNSSSPTYSIGHGGSTNLWHNGLVIPSDKSLERFPIDLNELKSYCVNAFNFLSDNKIESSRKNYNYLKSKLVNIGFKKSCLNNFIYYSEKRFNSFNSIFKNEKYDSHFIGRLVDADVFNNEVKALSISTDEGIVSIKSKVFIFCCGGLFTRPILESLLNIKVSNEQVYGYNDHPSSYVGLVNLNKNISKYWNHSMSGGWLRAPFIYNVDGLEITFQLRPSYQFNSSGKNFKSILSDLRNNYLSLQHYFSLLKNIDDLFEAISLKLRYNFPTKKYHILMVAEQSPSLEFPLSIQNDENYRNWVVSDSDTNKYYQAVKLLKRDLEPITTSFSFFPNWKNSIFSSSHHSGSLGLIYENSFLDSNLKISSFKNIYVCDGSVIPSTGFANTGVTICALGLRLADFINSLLLQSRN